ncbi:MAG: sigma-70 family RNA polymerase sigma factor, partial [Bacteroidota bacterium]
LLHKLPKQNVRHISSWLYMVTRNHCVQVIRDRKLQYMRPCDEMYAIGERDPEFEFDGCRAEERLLQAITELAPMQKKCIQHFYFEKLRYAEISKRTGLELKQVKSHLQNGKRMLRNQMVHAMAG